MHTGRTTARWIVLLGVVGVIALLDGPALVASQAGAGALFRDAQVRGELATLVGRADPTQLRARFVFVNHDALPDPAGGAQESPRGTSLTLNLFEDASFTAVLDRLETRSSGITWAGHIPGIDLSTVTLVTENEVMAGSIVTPEAAYRSDMRAMAAVRSLKSTSRNAPRTPSRPRILPVQPGTRIGGRFRNRTPLQPST